MKQQVKHFVICLMLGLFSTRIVHAQICAPPVVDQNTYGLSGIGDGCTLKGQFFGVTFNAEWIPNIHFFKGLFTGSCNRHDKCLVQLGNTAAACNGEFHSNMRSACSSRYKWYQPIERQICNDTAYQYYAAVNSAQTEAATQEMQRSTVIASARLGSDVSLNVCGTTPQRSELYSNGILNEVNNAFYMIAGRAPTAFEAFDVINSTSYIDNPSQWRSNLSRMASFYATRTPPAISISTDSSWGLTFIANDLPFSAYTWKVNGITSYDRSISAYPYSPEYNVTIRSQGFLQVVQGDSRNLLIIDQYDTILGYCGSTYGQICN